MYSFKSFLNNILDRKFYIATYTQDNVVIKIYENNKNKLTAILDKLGFSYIRPEGAFYLFMKTPENDKLFVEKAKKEIENPRVLTHSGILLFLTTAIRIEKSGSFIKISKTYLSFLFFIATVNRTSDFLSLQSNFNTSRGICLL